MIRNVSDNSDRSIRQDEALHPVEQRLCALLEQRVRQIVAETDRVSDSEWLTVTEVARKLKVSVDTI